MTNDQTMTDDHIINVAATAANIYDGMFHNGRCSAIVEKWGQGFLELTLELGQYALYSERKLIASPPQDFPGVYDYEVSEPFGAWFGDQILNNEDPPTKDEATAKFDELFAAFFKKNEIPA